VKGSTPDDTFFLLFASFWTISFFSILSTPSHCVCCGKA
jgi:hypothetical protein